MWQEIAPWLGTGGLGILAWVLVVFHRSAVRAHDKRADEMRALLLKEQEISAELRSQWSLLLPPGGGQRRRGQPSGAGRT